MASGTAGIYAALFASRWRAQYQYRTSFWLMMGGNAAATALDLVNILVLFHHVPALGDWSLPEVVLLYGISTMGLRLADLFMGGVEFLPDHVRSGRLDTFLVRPLGSLGQMITAEVSTRQIGGAIQGLVVLGWALANAPVPWSADRVAVVALMMGSAAVIFMGLWIATNAIAFWFVEAREIANAFTYGGGFAGQYPWHIFGSVLRRMLVTFIPVAFAGYFPALYLLDRPVPFGWPSWLRLVSPLVAAGVAVAAAGIWRAGLRRYTSTGS